MDVIGFFESKINYLLTMSFGDLIDIIIVAYLIYKIIDLIRKTSSYNLAKGVIVIMIALWVSSEFHLTMINYLLRKMVEIGLIALVIIFQPELRKLLSRIGSKEFYWFLPPKVAHVSEAENAITQTVIACENMAATKTGALIIFERSVKLNDIITTGTVLDADITAELLKNIFYPKAPLHDGALIVRNNRISAAGCVLPLTSKTNLSKDLGMRHRAGIGISEQSDAVVVIVSEETGAISVAIEGMLKRKLDRTTFEKILRAELINEDAKERPARAFIKQLRGIFKVNADERKES